MTKLSKEAEKILAEFKQVHKTEPDLYNNLRGAIDRNPAVIQQINHAVKAGTLQHITNDGPNGVAAQYDPTKNTIQLSANWLKNSPSTNNLTFVCLLGHELRHAENKTATAESRSEFNTESSKIAQQKNGRDYTAPLNKMIAANRKDEAQAHIAGWNAAMTQAKITNPNITAPQLAKKIGYGVHFFDLTKDKPQPLSGITIEKDGSIKLSESNVEALGKSYFDMPANRAKLGPNQVDYRSHYAANLISTIANNESAYASKHAPNTYPSINMAQVGLNQALLQKAGLKIKNPPLNLVDTSDPKHPKTMHLYNGTTVPTGKPSIVSTTENNQQLQTQDQPPQKPQAEQPSTPSNTNKSLFETLIDEVLERSKPNHQQTDQHLTTPLQR
jgi:hypothetical protein